MIARNTLLAGLIFVALAALAAGVYYFGRGNRYLIYTNPYAGSCWDAVQLLMAPDASVRPVRVLAPAREVGAGPIEATIAFRVDRVLAGGTLDATCAYAGDDQHPFSVKVNGKPVDAEALSRVQHALRH